MPEPTDKRTPLTKWHRGLLNAQRWIRNYDGATVYEYEVIDLLTDEALSALLREKRRRRA